MSPGLHSQSVLVPTKSGSLQQSAIDFGFLGLTALVSNDLRVLTAPYRKRRERRLVILQQLQWDPGASVRQDVGEAVAMHLPIPHVKRGSGGWT